MVCGGRRFGTQEDDRLLTTARMTQPALTLVRLRKAEKLLLQQIVAELAAA